MKLIYITVTMPFGNAEQFLIPEAFELVRQGQILIIPRSPLGDLVNTDAKGLRNVTVVQPLLSVEIISTAACEFVRNPVKSLRALGILFLSRNLKSLLKNLAVFPKSLWLSRIARKWGATHIHAQWASTTASMALFASTVLEIPWSLTAHRGDIATNNLLKLKFEKASFVRFISESGVALAQSFGVNLSKVNYKVIHMGVNLPEAYQSNRNIVGKPVIICPAYFIPVKGHKYLLQAIAILRKRKVDCLLQLAGEGYLQDHLQKEVEQLGIRDMVQFLGHIPHDRLMKMYRDGKVNLVVLPSLDLGDGLHEGIPVSLIEAMGFGIPVISTVTGGIPELLLDGAGILVPPEDQLALADAIELVVENHTERLAFIQNARNRVMKQFAIESVVTDLLNCLTSHTSS
jgi:colanic acid/amylovoran biosynthesis glycosyltransferase